jgi:hypothetical protein
MGYIENLLNKKSRRELILWTAALMAVTVLLLFVLSFLFSSESNLSRTLNWADPSKYQAVFLSNGQVYFGKIVNANKDTLILEDIYYLRASSPLQAGSNEAETEEENFSLIKLGNEIHGPEDGMKINLAHVMFIEDLKWDSKVIEAINEYKLK